MARNPLGVQPKIDPPSPERPREYRQPVGSGSVASPVIRRRRRIVLLPLLRSRMMLVYQADGRRSRKAGARV